VYKAFNQVVQGGIAEMMKTAMLDVEEFLASADLGHVLLQVHDSIEAEIEDDCPPGTRLAIKCTMARAVPKWLRKRTSPPIDMKVDDDCWTDPEKE
jgi:DNA polymerase I-like protein with 3'-5' exonuclease and polymerase domains